MPRSGLAVIVEDALSLAVARRLLAHVDPPRSATLQRVMSGVTRIQAGLPKYRAASRVLPHLVMVDLDRHACPAAMRAAWDIAGPQPGLLFAVAVRETEAWLLADRTGFAMFAGVPATKLPLNPEELPDPKQTLVNLVRRCAKRRLAQEIVPAQGSRLAIGPLYNETLSAFVLESWDLEAAAAAAPSLARTLERLRDLR